VVDQTSVRFGGSNRIDPNRTDFPPNRTDFGPYIYYDFTRIFAVFPCRYPKKTDMYLYGIYFVSQSDMNCDLLCDETGKKLITFNVWKSEICHKGVRDSFSCIIIPTYDKFNCVSCRNTVTPFLQCVARVCVRRGTPPVNNYNCAPRPHVQYHMC
jgi:hypothetical protein